MRVSLLLAVILLVGWCFSQGNPGPDKHNKGASTQGGVNAQKSEYESPQSPAVSGPPTQARSEEKRAEDHESPDGRVYRVNVVPEPTNGWTIAYVFITGAIGAAGLISIALLWRQTNIAKIAAEAAYVNAQAVINAERAWVMADLAFRPGFGLTKVTHRAIDDSGTVDRTVASVELRVQNCGPTPAWIFEQWICLDVANFVVASATEYPSPTFPQREGGKVCRLNYSIMPMVKGQDSVAWTVDVDDAAVTAIYSLNLSPL